MNPLITSLSNVALGAPKRCKGGSAKADHISLLTSLRLRSGFILTLFALSSLALCQLAEAVSPAPDGGYPNFNTAEGDDALFNLTTGGADTAVGFDALYSNTTGIGNTAIGDSALAGNITGFDNMASGFTALYSNTTGFDNTASGFSALYSNTTGSDNTAIGANALAFNIGSANVATGSYALFFNTSGQENTANGALALSSNTTGDENTASGVRALYSNTIGSQNAATGEDALYSNTTGFANTASGVAALYNNTNGTSNTVDGVNALLNNTTGSYNIALGVNAGQNLTTGDFNIDIGNAGVASENSTIRIGTQGRHSKTFIAGVVGTGVMGVAVKVTAAGQLGTAPSSARFKDEIKPMDKASEAILALKPVSFRYKKEIDPEATPQFGLVAEDVEKVNPDLVVRDPNGKPYTVRYDAVNAMLLNEFLKEHRKVEQLKKEFRATVGELTARLKEQDAQIQKVRAHLELSRPTPQLADNHQ